MLKNNNQTTIKQIAKKSMKTNGLRNSFAILAIILTTFMFTAVFSVGVSLGKNMSVMMIREQGTAASIFLKNPTDKQMEQVRTNGLVESAGVQVTVGKVSLKSGSILSLAYYDKENFDKNYGPAISDVKGAYPVKENEIMLSQSALDELKMKEPKVGQNVSIDWKGKKEIFRLSGWFQDYESFSVGCRTFVSKTYMEKQGLRVEQDGVLCIASKTGKQTKLLRQLDKDVALEKNQEFESSYNPDENTLETGMVIGIIIFVIGGIIILSGYLLIYNVMYISVTKDIRFYGMLKTLGTSPKQIKKIVKMQAMKLSVIGISVGILLGTVLSFVVVPYSMKMFDGGVNGGSSMPTDIVFHPIIYLGTIIFALLTVALSCRKPAKIASRVSPVEALKYTGIKSKSKKEKKSKKRQKKTKKGERLYRMAFRNVFREKKRTMLVFASLFMGTMAFLSVNTFVGSLKIENFVKYYIPYDVSLYMSQENDPDSKNANELYDNLKDLDGIKDIYINRSVEAEYPFDEDLFDSFIKQDAKRTDEKNMDIIMDKYRKGEQAFGGTIYSVSETMMETYNKKAKKKVDIDQFKAGKICFVGYVSNQKEADKMIGKTIKVTDPSTGKWKELTIGAVGLNSCDYGISLGYTYKNLGAPDCIVVSQNALEELSATPNVDNIMINCEKDATNYINSQVKKYTKNNRAVEQVEIKEDEISGFKSSMTSMNVLTSGISVVLILIGLLNFINVMLTGAYTRKQEFAVLESVGMTKRQTKKMLLYEGLYYGIITN